MIRSFVHKGLKQVFETGQSAKVGADLVTRCKRRLDAINAAISPEELNVPGFDFHALEEKPKRYTVHVNGPYCITFGWRDGDACLENYH